MSPLLEALNEYERYGVILTDRTHTRLFTVFLGEIEEQREVFATAEVKHIKTISKDQPRSQASIQRKSEVHARWHLKHVAEVMDRLEHISSFDRLVLAGPVQATSALRRLLSKRLRSRVIGTATLSIQASEPQVLQETLKIEQEIENAAQIKLVDELITAAAKLDQAVLGLEPTLAAIREGKIWRMVYAEGFSPAGRECPNCSSLFVAQPATCTYCETGLLELEDLIERMDAGVTGSGGRVELVRGTAAQRLRSAGGIGAFLRF